MHFDPFDEQLSGIAEPPIVSGSLVSEKFALYGSDLVHNEGRRIGNFMSVYIQCENGRERLEYIEKLAPTKQNTHNDANAPLIEITDIFDVRWIFGI